MSLKYDRIKYLLLHGDIADAVEAYKNGEKNSKKKLHNFVRYRRMSEQDYNKLIEMYGVFHRINKEKKEKELSRKIKSIICDIVAVVVMFFSLLCTLCYLIDYGEAFVLLYFLLFCWAILHFYKQH